MEKIIIQQSDHPHVLEASKVHVTEENDCKLIQIEGQGVIIHGEHGSMTLESEHIIQYVQQEFNPLTKRFDNAYD